MEEQVSSQFLFKNITSSLKNGNMIKYLKSTMEKTWQILLIQISGINFNNLKKNK